jgi:hypothetical protein
MNKYLIGFLITILIVIYFFKNYEKENFDILGSKTNLITYILKEKYRIIGGEKNKVLLASTNIATKNTPVILYTIFDDKTLQNYYYIYNHGKIMTYVNGEIYFNQASVDSILSPNFSFNCKLYKTSDNKLYYFISNTMMYLSASKIDCDPDNPNTCLKNNYKIGVDSNPIHALTWDFS